MPSFMSASGGGFTTMYDDECGADAQRPTLLYISDSGFNQDGDVVAATKSRRSHPRSRASGRFESPTPRPDGRAVEIREPTQRWPARA